jgi:GDP-L-fucose synthase
MAPTFISVMPTNLYGPEDNYHAQNSHVPAALIRRFHEGKLSGAQAVTVWGTGRPRREFLCSDDLADACVFLMKHYSDFGFLNVGTGEDITIAQFAELVCETVNYKGKITFDTSRPDGPPQKLLDISKIKALGWAPKVSLREGLARAYSDFLSGAGCSAA